MFSRLFLVAAAISLFHAAYSVFERKWTQRAQPEASLPFNVVYESVFALVLGTLGASLGTPPLKDITWSSEMKKRTIDEMDSRSGFANHHTRAKPFLAPLPPGQS